MNDSARNPQKRKAGRPPSATLAEAFPDLAAQLVDRSLADTLSKGSSDRVLWQCEKGHQWEARVYNRTNAKNTTGCPVCAGKVVVAGINDVATTRPDVAIFFADQSLTTSTTAFSNKKILMRCPVDARHEWSAPPSRLAAGQGGCPYCSGRISVAGETDLATTHPALAAELADQSLATVLKSGSSRRVEWICQVNPQHRWHATPFARASRGTGCPICSGRSPHQGFTDLAATHPGLAAQLVAPAEAHTVSHGSDKQLRWQCTANTEHTWLATVGNREKGGCPVCANRLVVPGENDLGTTHPELARELADPADAMTVTAGSKTVLEWVCQRNDQHRWKIAPYHRIGRKPTGCPLCFGPLPSRGERALADTIAALVAPEPILTSDQTTLPGRHELDIVVPSRSLAVEFNGVYWHSDASGKPRDFHAAKSARAVEAGMQLIHVWEDDWETRPTVVLRAIAHKLHATARLLDVLPDADPKIAERVFARNLAVDETRGEEAARFLDDNHIQGSVVATRHIVLRDDDGDIRAMLSIRSPRNNARLNRDAGAWEIQRFATCGIVPGAFTRLLRHAERILAQDGITLSRWVSFSSQDISDGGMYEAAGFEAEHTLPPDYRYVGNLTGWRRQPKEAFQRKRFREDPNLIWDESWTERQAADENNLYRVYDAGKTRWVKSVG